MLFQRLQNRNLKNEKSIYFFLVLIIPFGGFSDSTFTDKLAELEKKLATAKGKDKVDVLNDLADNYCLISPDKSLVLAKQAFETSKKLKYRKGEALAVFITSWGYRQLGDRVKALDFAEKSLQIQEKINDKKGIASSLNIFGLIHGDLANYDKALGYHRKSLKIAEEIGDKNGTGSSLNNIGLIHFNLANYEKALEYYHKSLKILEEIGDKNGTGSSLNNIGVIYYSLSNYEKALEYYHKSLKILKKIGDKKSIFVSLNNIGRVYANLCNYEKALEYHQKSLIIKEEILDKNGIGSSLNNIGYVYYSLGNYEKALEYQHKSLKICEEIGDKKRFAQSANDVGSIYDKLNKFLDSIYYFNKSIAIGKEIKSPNVLWNAYAGLGSNYKHQKKYVQAVDYFVKGIGVLEATRRMLEVEENQSGFFKTKLTIYENLIDSLIQAHRQDEKKGYDVQSFYYAEKAKGRSFLDRLQEAKITQSILSPEFRHKQKNIEGKYSSVIRKLQRINLADEQRENLLKELDAKEEELQKLEIEIKKKDPGYANLVYFEPYGLSRVQKTLLDDKTAILEYLIGEENLFIFLIKKNDFKVKQLVIDKNYEKSLENYAGMLSVKEREFKGIEVSQRFYEELIKPFREKLSRIENLIIIPDGMLHYLPFESLISTSNGKKTRYLLEDFNIFYAPSASSLCWLLEQQRVVKPYKDLLAVANPVYKKETLTDKVFNVFRDYYQGFKGFDLANLNYSDKEVKDISKYFKTNMQDVYTKHMATEDLFKTLPLKNYKILHFAMHGLLDEKNPLRSALAFTLDPDAKEDGFLQAREIYQLKVNADLVVLSACQTGLGKLERGEGVMGLTRAFFYAGARSVLSTLWKIDDASTSNFMNSFYKYLSEHKSKMTALRLAKQEMIKSKYNHPFYWAAFIINGDAYSGINLSR